MNNKWIDKNHVLNRNVNWTGDDLVWNNAMNNGLYCNSGSKIFYILLSTVYKNISLRIDIFFIKHFLIFRILRIQQL